MQLQDKLLELKHSGKAILAANFYNFETLTGILSAAAIENSPVILQLSESSIKYMGLALSANMARTALREYSVTGWLHLDHGSSLDLIHRCLDAGFDHRLQRGQVIRLRCDSVEGIEGEEILNPQCLGHFSSVSRDSVFSDSVC